MQREVVLLVRKYCGIRKVYMFLELSFFFSPSMPSRRDCVCERFHGRVWSKHVFGMTQQVQLYRWCKESFFIGCCRSCQNSHLNCLFSINLKLFLQTRGLTRVYHCIWYRQEFMGATSKILIEQFKTVKEITDNSLIVHQRVAGHISFFFFSFSILLYKSNQMLEAKFMQ